MSGYTEVSQLMKTLAHPVRLMILEILEHEGEACVCHIEILLQQRQAYISQHLTRLRKANLVVDRREGLNIYYSIAHPSVNTLLQHAKESARVLAGLREEQLEFQHLQYDLLQNCACPRCEEAVRTKL